MNVFSIKCFLQWPPLTFALGKQKLSVVCPICNGLIRNLENNFCLSSSSLSPRIVSTTPPCLRKNHTWEQSFLSLSVRPAPGSVRSAAMWPATFLNVYIGISILLQRGSLTGIPTSSECACKCNSLSDRMQPSSLSETQSPVNALVIVPVRFPSDRFDANMGI